MIPPVCLHYHGMRSFVTGAVHCAARGLRAGGGGGGRERGFRRRSSTWSSSNDLFELRSYTLHPHVAKEYVRLVSDAAAVRMRALPSLMGFWLTDTGGDVNVVHHVYRYRNLEERAETRRKLAMDDEWKEHLREAMPCVLQMRSEVFRAADDVMQAADAARRMRGSEETGGNTDDDNHNHRHNRHGRPPGVYEMREYQLVAGYDSVPKLRDAFVRGIRSKLHADKEGELSFFGYTELGQLNRVIEIWRYPSAQACLDGRVAARGAQEWRACIGAAAPLAARFNSSLMTPLAFSPWQ